MNADTREFPPYHTPVLKEHGSLQELTQASSGTFNPASDNVSGYTSDTPGMPGS